MTIEQRKKNLIKKIKKLGIVDIHFDGGNPNANKLETYEATIKIIERERSLLYRIKKKLTAWRLKIVGRQ